MDKPLNKYVFSDVDFIAAEQNAVRDGCSTNITLLKSRSETRQVQTEIPVPERTANVQLEPAPSTSGLNRSSLGLAFSHTINPATEIRRGVTGEEKLL
ncbi:hypothetical protein WA026_015156 [Henosepilachna vigintioctopunctata]|uniref:Uncharacterized protein n=1 Tax=Henosepilachna vigintioctopunctata TaxID=420089 RepID=A0AAW1TUY3_9CUCU